MASRFYTPLEEEALDPRYNQGTPFDEDPSAYDTPNESPFAENSPSGAPPPSVEQSKAAKPKGSPFDTPDPRLTELDQQIKGRPRSIGGMIAAFSPQGDKSLQNLMAQRHMYGQEVHGDRQLQRQLENSRLINESQNKHWETLARNADVAAAQRAASAGDRAGAQVTVGAGHDIARVQGDTIRANRPMTVGAGASVYNPATGENSEQNAFRPQSTPAARPQVDPQTMLLQKKLVGLQQAITKAQASGTADPAVIGELQRQYNETKRQMGAFGTQGGAPPAAPAKPAPATGPTATGPNGEKIMWDGTAWVPAS